MKQLKLIFCIISIIVCTVASVNAEQSRDYKSYEAVIQNNKKVFIDGNQKTLDEYLSELDDKIALTHFTLIDMDNDNVNELILEYGNEYYTVVYLVLHGFMDSVYMYDFPVRAFNTLRIDGTFEYSSGAADSGIGCLDFTGEEGVLKPLVFTKYNKNKIIYCQRAKNGNKIISKHRYNKLLNSQYNKKEPIWTVFSYEALSNRLNMQKP